MDQSGAQRDDGVLRIERISAKETTTESYLKGAASLLEVAMVSGGKLCRGNAQEEEIQVQKVPGVLDLALTLRVFDPGARNEVSLVFVHQSFLRGGGRRYPHGRLKVMHVREQIAGALDLIVHMTRLSDGRRAVGRISALEGMRGGSILLQDVFPWQRGRQGMGRLHLLTGVAYHSTGIPEGGLTFTCAVPPNPSAVPRDAGPKAHSPAAAPYRGSFHV